MSYFFSIICYSSKNINYKEVYDKIAEEEYFHHFWKAQRKRKHPNLINNDKFIDPSFEVIFIGDSPPAKQIPRNFRYIQSKENFTKCIEIGVENSQSDYLIFVNENMTYSSMYLSWLYMFTTRVLFHFDKVIILPRYSFKGEIRQDLMHFDINDELSPLVSRSFLCKKKDFFDIGGINKDFNGDLCIIDIQMRFYKNGYTPFIVPMAVNDETYVSDVDINDKLILDSLWKISRDE